MSFGMNWDGLFESLAYLLVDSEPSGRNNDPHLSRYPDETLPWKSTMEQRRSAGTANNSVREVASGLKWYSPAAFLQLSSYFFLVKNLSTELIITYVGATAQGQNITMLLNVTSIISIDSNLLTDV